MDLFGLTDAIKKRRQLLDSIDQPVMPTLKAQPVTPAPAPVQTGGAYSGMSQAEIDDIRARRKKLQGDW